MAEPSPSAAAAEATLKKAAASSSPSSSSSSSMASITKDISLLNQSIDQSSAVISAMESLEDDGPPWSKAGYFDSTQHDSIDHLFFRFLVLRGVLVSLALLERNNNYSTADHDTKASRLDTGAGRKGDGGGNGDLQHALARAESSFGDDDESDLDHALRTMIILASAMALFVYEVKLVKCFKDDKIAIAKLNERFYRSNIDSNTFDKLRLEVTDTSICDGRVQSLVKAYNELYSEESDVHSILQGLQASKELSQLIDSLGKEADGLVQEYLGRPRLQLRKKLNHIQHSPMANVARNAKMGTKNILVETRAHTFKGVSRLKSPAAYLIKFSNEQKRDVLQCLQPGDLVFTYTAGYMSDIFIPGAFKHGITFVGNTTDRNDVGLNADNVARIYDDLPEGEVQKLLDQFQVASLPSGKNADVIEAVVEGVIFNNLCHLMDTHVNRLLVLRPQVTSEEKIDALIGTFRFLGDKYDFGFDFKDASAVVCTEVIYHAFNGKGKLSFELTKRAGNPTLSADDIVNYYLAKPGSFDFVLLALEDKESSSHDAKIYVGDEGQNVLTNLMKSELGK